jgi:spermidine synthase|tara:strand:- start:5559 stop:8486 length:2928 start_codon:yes stop_codon:yes gene_type:complete
LKTRSLLFTIFTLSGFSGLIYESIWTHYIKLLLGHAAYAQTLVLSIFLAGLASGSWLASRSLTRIRNPLIGYILVELLLGVFGFSFHRVFDNSIEYFYSSSVVVDNPGPFLEAVKWSLATILILPQAVLLGMTFPWMSTALVRLAPDKAGSSISLLYFTNSIGGAIGVLTSGFILVGKVGLPGTLMVAAAINIFIALVLWPSRKNALLVESVQGAARSSASAWSGRNNMFLLIAALTGLASFFYEIAWIRMLSMVLSSAMQSFELMLSAFITGLAFGGLWIRKRINDIRNLEQFLGVVQILMGMFAVLTLPLYIASFDLMEFLVKALARNDPGYVVYNLASHLICLMVMLPATFMAGMTLPLISNILIRGSYGESAIGFVYASNTIGGIVGVLTAVHILMITVGSKGLIVVGAGVDIALGVYLLTLSSQRRWVWASSLLAIGLVVTTAVVQDFSPKKIASGVYRSGNAEIPEEDEVIYYKDGKTASIAVIKTAADALFISTNGKADAAISLSAGEHSHDEMTMALLAVIPLALKPDTATAANIGFGSGMTTHVLLGAESIEQVDTIEIEQAVIDGARHFGKANERAYVDQRSRIHIDDAKSFFARKGRRYDVIISEPSNPWVSGVANLFSDEFYRHLKPHLNEDGLLVQWIQLYEINFDQVSSIIRALHNNFPHFEIYNTYRADMLIVAASNPIKPLDSWVFDQPAIKETLATVGIYDLYDLQLRKLGNERIMGAPFTGFDGTMNSDYYPYLGLTAPRSRFLKSSAYEYNAQLRYAPVPILANLNGFRIRKLTDPRKFRNLDYYRKYNAAMGLVELFDETTSNRHSLEQNHLVHFLKSEIGDCIIADALSYIRTLAQLAASINPYLPEEEAVEIWNLLDGKICRLDGASEVLDWIALHRSVASRDYDKMLELAEQLIASLEVDPEDSLLSYLWQTILLADYMIGDFEHAVEFASSHQIAPNPVVTFLLLNIYEAR